MSEMTFIYALKEPCSGMVRYVGKADDVKIRYYRHCCNSQSERRNNHCGRWLNALLARGKKPTLEILEEVPKTNWQERERHWISFFKGIGCILVNSTEGGEGHSAMSPETREKLRCKMLGEKNPFFGRKHSAETKEKMRQVKLGKKYSCEVNKKKGSPGEKNPFFGKQHSPETIEFFKNKAVKQPRRNGVWSKKEDVSHLGA